MAIKIKISEATVELFGILVCSYLYKSLPICLFPSLSQLNRQIYTTLAEPSQSSTRRSALQFRLH